MSNGVPYYVTCRCQYCDGGIEFDANQLAGVDSLFPCPHCGVETKLVVPKPKPEVVAKSPDYWQRVLQQKNATGRSNLRQEKSPKVTLAKSQLSTPLGKELIAVLLEIERDGFVEVDGVRRLHEWLLPKVDSGIFAINFLLGISKKVLRPGRPTSEEIQEMQLAIERVLPKDLRESVVVKRRAAEERLRQQEPASKELLDRIRELGGNPPEGMTYGEACELKDKLYHQATDKQINYIRALGGFPSPGLTRFEAIDLIQELLSSTKATEEQLKYIRDLGGNPPATLSQAAASGMMEQLLARRQPTPRQMMVLRFWNRLDLAKSSKEQIAEWLDGFYAEDPRRKEAWDRFKVEIGDDGLQGDPSVVPLGAGNRYICS